MATHVFQFVMTFHVHISPAAKKLNEQCFYDLTCMHNDENSICTQISHNAVCQCKEKFHEVTHSKPTRRTFCTPGDLSDEMGA